MLRTRDVYVFAVILLILCVGILVTYVHDSHLSFFNGTSVVFDTNSTASTTFTAIAPENKRDRSSAIARLRDAILQSDDVITQSPSVETVAVVKDESNDVVLQEGTKIQRCAGQDDSLTIARSWPLSGTSITVQNGMRSVMYAHQEIVLPVAIETASTSTSTPSVPKMVTTSLLTLALYPPMQSDATCVPSDWIGVTATGALLSNADASRYYDAPEAELLGFARDGFPIYGAYQKETDECGGYIHPEGYRYTISKERDFIVGCFVGAPQKFNTL